MKIFVAPPDLSERVDGTVKHNLLDHFENAQSQNEADVVVIPFTFFPDFKHNYRLDEIKKPWVFFDMGEYGSAWKMDDTHLWGVNLDLMPHLQTHEFITFHNWVKDHPPALYLKRELLKKDVSERVQPLAFPCYLPDNAKRDRHEFNSRPISVFNSWGYSHESRPRIHGDIFRCMATHGVEVLGHWDQWQRVSESTGLWSSIFSPHYVRRPIQEVLNWSGKSKITLSLPGAGRVCFRTTEITNSVMAMYQDDIAFSFDWEHGFNCLRFNFGTEIMDLRQFLEIECLYEIYLSGLDTLDKYRTKNYVQYLTGLIEKAL